MFNFDQSACRKLEMCTFGLHRNKKSQGFFFFTEM